MGKRADLVVIDRDPCEAAGDERREINADLVMIDGEVVHLREGAAAPDTKLRAALAPMERAAVSAPAVRAPLVVGIGGSTASQSTSERVLDAVLRASESYGAVTRRWTGAELAFPMYAPEQAERSPLLLEFLATMSAADGVIIASPGYHGGVSGLIKNALDYLEDLRTDPRPYLSGRAVGCVACAAGWQATGATLAALRSIVHALRGWPAPLGITVNATAPAFAAAGDDSVLAGQIDELARQVVEFAYRHAGLG